MRFTFISKLLIASALALTSTLGVASAQTVTRTVAPYTSGNFNTFITIPARDPSLPPMQFVTVTTTLNVDRFYGIRNLAPDTYGQVEFNSAIFGGTFQRCQVLGPLGGFVNTSQLTLAPRMFTVGVFEPMNSGSDMAMMSETFTVTSTQISAVNPEAWTGTGDLVLPVNFNCIAAYQQFSGYCLSRQSWITSATITVTYQ